MATTITPEDLRELVMTHLNENKVKDQDRVDLLEELTTLIEQDLEVIAERTMEAAIENVDDDEEIDEDDITDSAYPGEPKN